MRDFTLLTLLVYLTHISPLSAQELAIAEAASESDSTTKAEASEESVEYPDTSPEEASEPAYVETFEPEPDPLTEFREELDLLRAETSLREQRIKNELADQIEQTQRLQIESALRRAQLQETLAGMQAERDTIQAELALQEAKLSVELAELSQENQRLEKELMVAEKKARQELSTITMERERLKTEFSLREQRLRSELAEKDLERLRIQSEVTAAGDRLKLRELEIQAEKIELVHEAQKLDLERKRLLAENEKAAVELVRLKQRLELRAQEKEWMRAVNDPLEYPDQPFNGTILAISDRRIPLNGPIITGTANFVTERIHFFNNQNPEAPIFIIIDNSPGGSVMEGYRILKAMEASPAPIHVVVKSFAASMAAVILTMAEESYAYPNAVILHHQPWTFSRGNLTQQSEQMEIFKDWAERLHKPVADRMGISLEAFYKMMYENNSMGDWQEFADKAVELKWVEHIAQEVREEGILEQPSSRAPRPFFFFASGNESELVAEEGLEARIPRAAMLPSPQPFDFYFLFNRTGFYSWPTN